MIFLLIASFCFLGHSDPFEKSCKVNKRSLYQRWKKAISETSSSLSMISYSVPNIDNHLFLICLDQDCNFDNVDETVYILNTVFLPIKGPPNISPSFVDLHDA